MPKRFSHIDDEGLMNVLRYNEDAFTEIYNRYWDRLLYMAAIKLKSLALAEELVQDVFLDIWKRRQEIQITGNLESYLSVAIKYRIINALAKMKREQAMRENQLAVEVSTEPWLDERELSKNLQILVSKLPEKCRITYQLSREEGLPLKEIAHKMAVSQKAVEANLTRTLKLLRFGLRKMLLSLLLFCSQLPAITVV